MHVTSQLILCKHRRAVANRLRPFNHPRLHHRIPSIWRSERGSIATTAYRQVLYIQSTLLNPPRPSSTRKIPKMATKLGRSRALAQALRSTKPSIQAPRHEAAARCFSISAHANSYKVHIPKDAKNLRLAERETLGTLEAPIVNPTDKYQSKADNLHRYGAWLMGCLPKYIQQFSVWKDELTIYICPSGVIPVFSFLKCKLPPSLVLDCR